ncbi:hypothetical protein RintRC_7492 [Richelia intracellularis]|nr:hypothetical protein RintRC_7492 [Richelia intracellularis]
MACNLAPSPGSCEIAVGSTMAGFVGTLVDEVACDSSDFVVVKFTLVSGTAVLASAFWLSTGFPARA